MTTKTVSDEDPFVILGNVNYGGNPIERTTVLQAIRVPLSGIRFAEFILVPPRRLGLHSPVQHAQLRFVFQPEHHPTLLSLSGARAGTDSRFPDLVLSWESWSPPHVHYNFIKGMDSSAYRLTLRAYDGPTVPPAVATPEGPCPPGQGIRRPAFAVRFGRIDL